MAVQVRPSALVSERIPGESDKDTVIVATATVGVAPYVSDSDSDEDPIPMPRRMRTLMSGSLGSFETTRSTSSDSMTDEGQGEDENEKEKDQDDVAPPRVVKGVQSTVDAPATVLPASSEDLEAPAADATFTIPQHLQQRTRSTKGKGNNKAASPVKRKGRSASVEKPTKVAKVREVPKDLPQDNKKQQQEKHVETGQKETVPVRRSVRRMLAAQKQNKEKSISEEEQTPVENQKRVNVKPRPTTKRARNPPRGRNAKSKEKNEIANVQEPKPASPEREEEAVIVPATEPPSSQSVSQKSNSSQSLAGPSSSQGLSSSQQSGSSQSSRTRERRRSIFELARTALPDINDSASDSLIELPRRRGGRKPGVPLKKNSSRETSPGRYVGKDPFGNYEMLNTEKVSALLKKVKPDSKFNQQKLEGFTLKINNFLEDFFDFHCNETSQYYGYIPFSELKQALIDQCLLDEDASSDDLIREMRRSFNDEQFAAGEGVLFPSRYSVNRDTNDYLVK